MQVRHAARILAFALAGVAYVAGSHALMTQTRASAWNVVGVLSPMLVLITVGAWRSGQRRVAASAALVIAALCGQAVLGVQVPAHALYLTQHVGINLFLAALFGSTLRAGHTALITTLARRVHGGYVIPSMALYTRNLTRAWALFFVAMALVSLALFAGASFEAWAFFANWLTPMAVVLMFGGEYLIRYRLHPEFERSSVADAVRAYMQVGKVPAQPAPGGAGGIGVAPLIWDHDLEAPLAWRDGQAISRRQYLADVHRLATLLPERGEMLNLTGDRYRFAVGLGAAMLRGHNSLLPPNHTPDMFGRLRALFPAAYVLTDQPSSDTAVWPTVHHPTEPATAPARTDVPQIEQAALVVQVLTSGSTGAPVPHPKHWGLLCRGAHAGAQRLAQHMGRSTLAGVTLVSTVPAQHMYGLESTVLLALLGGASIDTERPFYPADIAAALFRAVRPRMLVTTPFHLKLLLDSGVALPAIDLTLCATAPLSPQLAARAEAALAAPLVEIYGCTETGQVATRRTVAGAEWQAFEGVHISGDGAASVAQGAHIPQATTLADVLEVISPTVFRLLGRSNDLINIAGKRSSLGHLNYHLNAIAGVHDGAFWLPPGEATDGVVRLIAFVVAPDCPPHELAEKVSSAMRQRVDAAFLPRRVVSVPALPRVPGTGKLPTQAFAAWAEQMLAAAAQRTASAG